jgi:hypothetical protein
MIKLTFDNRYRLERHERERDLRFDSGKAFSLISEILTKHGVSPATYYLGRADVDDRTCLYEEGEFWVVAHCERGARWSPCFFENYHDAVNFFVWNLLQQKANLPTINWKQVHE